MLPVLATLTPGQDVLDVPPERRPRHIAIIMDGNGRWAQNRSLPRAEGHRQGAESVRRTVEECVRLHNEQLTLYCLSSENWKRPQPELDFLMHLLERHMIDERDTLMRQNIVVQIIGRRDGIPERVQQEMDQTIALSAGNSGTRLCLAINYGGRAEMVDAVRRIARRVRLGELAVEDITEESIARHLYTAGMPDPDLLIRTGGEYRISNFLLWQMAYTEFYFTDILWPDFGEEDLRKAISDYQQRERRFGMTSGQIRP